METLIRLAGIRGVEMEVIKLGKKGQVSIPKSVLTSLGLTGDSLLLVDTTPEGGILLQPAAAYPIEVYDREYLAELAAGDLMTPEESERLASRLGMTPDETSFS
ncbi:MAG: AbrB/MazE/SpoVT family DNA-binding domain-containing protein [Synechocystis sp.]|nr:AbrB/MazE/SpoVT family DNA-binding domain-containing protein [Synechocystis sp.]